MSAVCLLLAGCSSAGTDGERFKSASGLLGVPIGNAKLQCEEGSSNPRLVFERADAPDARTLRRKGFHRTVLPSQWRRRYGEFSVTVGYLEGGAFALEVGASFNDDCRDLRDALRR